jgi:hypothetical protein
MRRRWLMIILAGLLAGCYSSAGSRHDAQQDPAHDPLLDPTPDPLQDPDFQVDPGAGDPPDLLPDVPPDLPPDSPPDVPPDGPACPPPQEVSVSFVVDGNEFPGRIDLEERCLVDTVIGEEEGHMVFELRCRSEAGEEVLHTLDVTTSPPAYIFLWEGESVLFRYRADNPWWFDRWFAVTTEYGNLALAGIDASAVTPWDVDPDGWYAPLGVSVVGGFCPYVPRDCGDEERVALSFTFDSMTAFQPDHSSGYVGMMVSYQLIVEQAVQYHGDVCDDFPEQWYRALFVSIPEG